MNITKEANLAAQWILDEKVIAYPTEGVWGIGGLNTPENIKAINLAKQRDETKNYILLFHSFQQLTKYFDIEDKYHSLIKKIENTFTTMIIPTKQEKIAAAIFSCFVGIIIVVNVFSIFLISEWYLSSISKYFVSC